ncbi:MAG TPA: hypothetical protein VHO24_12765 [Opitutaceae bacterium]|nr:hypothetical protein [Opitutaceae bacterium]
MLVPIFAGSAWRYAHTKDIGGSLVILFLGGVLSCFLFVILCSGFVSSNTGTYFRDKEPVRYWRDVGLLMLVYVAISICGYFRR